MRIQSFARTQEARDAIINLIDNSREYGEYNKEKIREYSCDTIDEKIMSIYESLIEKCDC